MVRTRFAPSPTGYLHIGGVRTALFNWLWARRHGGRFVLRIDDTDVGRNLDQALAPILDGFRWLGLDWDEGPEVGGAHAPYYQSQRGERHRAAVAELVERGHAYWDYATPEEIAAEREAARAEGRRFLYSRSFRAETAADRERFEAEGRRGAVRLAMPRQGACRFRDAVRGEVEFEWAREQDHVVQRADGTCLYNLATAVDDHEMEITHVIRAEEHLSNTPRQIFIAQALGWEPPVFAHIPFVAEPGSKVKLSKRKLGKYLKQPDFAGLVERARRIAQAAGTEAGDEALNPVLVELYRGAGFLPEALVNYLLLLGWSLDDRSEIFSRQEMIESFTLERVQKAPASFDPAKLMSFQERYMEALPAAAKVERVLPYLERAGLVAEPAPPEARRLVEGIIEAAGDRIKVAGDVLDYADFFVADDELTYDDKAFDQRIRKPPEALELLVELRLLLVALEPFDAASLEEVMRDVVERRGLKLGQIVHPVRLAVTGKAVGFGIFETLELLGRERCLARIDRALDRL